MKQNRTICVILAIVMAFLLTGCAGKTVLSERHDDTVEAAALLSHTGRLTREISAIDGESIDIHVKLSPKSGHISMSITNQAGDVCLSLNESATLPENGEVTVTVPSADLPCVIQTDMTQFTGEYEITWGV